eukprot:5803377-Pyramimonas_sp.AAC.2
MDIPLPRAIRDRSCAKESAKGSNDHSASSRPGRKRRKSGLAGAVGCAKSVIDVFRAGSQSSHAVLPQSSFSCRIGRS